MTNFVKTNLVKTNQAKPATWLAGYIADLPTPFDDDDRIDLMAFSQLCERQIAAGASAIVVGETAGEASTLSAPPSRSRVAGPASLPARARIQPPRPSN